MMQSRERGNHNCMANSAASFVCILYKGATDLSRISTGPRDRHQIPAIASMLRNHPLRVKVRSTYGSQYLNLLFALPVLLIVIQQLPPSTFLIKLIQVIRTSRRVQFTACRRIVLRARYKCNMLLDFVHVGKRTGVHRSWNEVASRLRLLRAESHLVKAVPQQERATYTTLFVFCTNLYL
ncbi:hypothetical protein BC832DRAFT_82090 [Gaertneriomyces semiglobifer]|nr:hypothetical protein BC832DRAFT_82090 [Gaertneriomyces semiglobifer]